MYKHDCKNLFGSGYTGLVDCKLNILIFCYIVLKKGFL